MTTIPADERLLLPRSIDFWKTATPREARARIVEALRFELLGPETLTEELRESPLTRYAVGMLAPFGTPTLPEEGDEELAGDGEDEDAAAAEPGTPISQSLSPSSIGLSFLIPADVNRLTVEVSWGDYTSDEIHEGPPSEPSPQDAIYTDEKSECAKT